MVFAGMASPFDARRAARDDGQNASPGSHANEVAGVGVTKRARTIGFYIRFAVTHSYPRTLLPAPSPNRLLASLAPSVLPWPPVPDQYRLPQSFPDCPASGDFY